MPDVALRLVYAAVAVWGVIHLFSGRLKVLDVTPRSIWLSIAGGVSVAYVFLDVLPELSAAQRDVAEAAPALSGLDRHVYLVALAGLAIFYGLERLAMSARSRQGGEQADSAVTGGAFWLHLGSFAVYNGLIGYLLLHREQQDLQSLLWYALAMALHFLVVDHGLREHYKQRYDRTGRFVLTGALVVGLVVGQLTSVPKAAVAILFALLAGGVILNVLKEELPRERESRWWAFVAGLVAYAGILMLT